MSGAKQLLFPALIGILALIFLGGCSDHPSDLISEQYEYDQEGRLKCKVAPDGQKTKYTYNDKGHLTKVIYPDTTVQFGYDAQGNRIWMQDGTGRTEYRYDAFDQLIGVVFKHSPEKKVTYSYDPWGRISNLRILAESQVEYEVNYEYDLFGNLLSIDHGDGRIEYTYYPEKGEIVRHLPNGIKTTFSFSALGELTALKHEDPPDKVIASYHYEYNSAGKVARVLEETADGLKITEYEWDSRGYLKALHLPDRNTIRYEYDAMGNRILQEGPNGTIRYEYDKFGRLTRAGDRQYKWDKNGSLVSQIEKQSKTRIRYDGRGLPTLVRIPGATIRYDWDGDGNMISRREGKEITHYLPSPLAPPGFTLAEFDDTGRLTASYLYGDVLLAQRDVNSGMKYFLEDGFNSIRYIADMNGKIAGQKNYTPFGESIAVREHAVCDFRMAGERFLPEIKSYVIGGRLYEPQLGRYLTSAPSLGYIERFDSFNKYAHSCRASGIFMEPRCNQTAKQNVYPTFNYWSEFAGNFFRGLPQSIMQGVKATVDFWRPSNIWAGFRGGWEIGVPHPETFAAQAEQYGGHLARKAVQSVLLQALLLEFELLTAGMLPKFRIPLGSWGHAAAGEHAAHGALHLGISASRGGKAILHFYPSRLFIHLGRLGGIDVPYGLLPYVFPSSRYDDKKGTALRDPFNSIEDQLGGIELAATGEFIGNLGKITGAVYDSEKQCLVLVGDNDLSVPSIKAEDLAVALILVFGSIPQDPQFSLDPADPRNPRGKWLKAVYIPEQIIGGTEFGKALFEADWLLKQYSFGVRIDGEGSLKERKSSVPGFKSTADLSLEQSDIEQGKEKWARFWIVSDEMKLKESGKSIYFDVAKMRVKAKKQVLDPTSRTGLRDVDTEDDPVATEFANLFTKLYDEITEESPEFERVRELAKVVALAKWLKKESVPVDMDWVVKYANKRVETIGEITALSIQWQKQSQRPYLQGGLTGIQTITHQLHLFGGVDLTVKPKYVSDDGRARSLQDVVKLKLRQKNAGPIFSVKHNGKTLQAAVLPITKSGQEMWKHSPCVEINGIVYQFNDKREVTKNIDRNDNITEYTYDSKGGLKTLTISNTNGWRIVGERNGAGSSWTVTNPRSNILRYKYDISGYLNEIEVDGHVWATYEFDQKQREVITRYNGYTERMIYDGNGNIREYGIQIDKDSQASAPEIERLIFDYNNLGNLTKIAGIGMPLANISYTEDGIKPTKIVTPQAEIRYSYDADGCIEEMTHSSGISTTYVYEGEQLTKLQIDYQGRQAKYLFNEDGIAQSRDLLGGIVDYGYTNGRLSSVKLAQYGEAKYVYDNQNRLQEIHFPNGNWIEYRYQQRGWQGKEGSSSQGELFTMVTHSSSTETTPKEIYETKDITLRRQLEDDIEASKILKNSLMLDLFVESKDSVYLNIVDSQNEVHEVDLEAAKDLRRLVNVTTKTRGKLGRTLLRQWEDFYNTHLASLAKPTYWLSPEGKEVTLKPILIIKSNEVNYKYANLERVPVLADNFLIFIASKETSAKELTNKINNIPKLTRENAVFAVRLPKMDREIQREWEEAVAELESIVGKENVLFNPSKEEFDRMLHNQDKEVVVIELTHTDRGIVLKDNEKYTSKDILEGDNLSHIKYLVTGPGTCSLPRLEKGDFIDALREKGVGVMNTSYREVLSETALKRLKKIIHILRKIEEYNLPAYRVFDIIDQLLGISEKGTTNLGKLDHHKDYLFS